MKKSISPVTSLFLFTRTKFALAANILIAALAARFVYVSLTGNDSTGLFAVFLLALVYFVLASACSIYVGVRNG